MSPRTETDVQVPLNNRAVLAVGLRQLDIDLVDPLEQTLVVEVLDSPTVPLEQGQLNLGLR
jgi:hypothetical protein